MKKVSVIITTFKRPISVVERALVSVINQDYDDIEVFIVNDYPEDKKNADALIRLANRYTNVTYLSYDKNHGACFARNYGAKHARGVFLSFLDDDDEWLKNKISTQVNCLLNDEVGLVYSPIFEYDNSHQGRIFNNSAIEGKVLKKLLEKNFLGGCSSVMVKKSVFEELGGFDESLLASQDYDLWIRIATKYDVSYCDTPTIMRYFGRDSISSNFNKKKMGWEGFLKKHKELYKRNKKAYNCTLNTIAISSFEFKKIGFALKNWIKACVVRPFSLRNLFTIPKGIYKMMRPKIYD